MSTLDHTSAEDQNKFKRRKLWAELRSKTWVMLLKTQKIWVSIESVGKGACREGSVWDGQNVREQWVRLGQRKCRRLEVDKLKLNPIGMRSHLRCLSWRDNQGNILLVAEPAYVCQRFSHGDFVKLQLLGPTLSFWFKRCGMKPENLHFLASPKQCCCC